MSKLKFGYAASIISLLVIVGVLLPYVRLLSTADGKHQQCSADQFCAATVANGESKISFDGLSTPASLTVSASSAILIEAESGSVLFAKNESVRRPMASTTKIMTGILALELSDPQKIVNVSPAAVGVEGSSIYLYAGEQLTMEQLIYALLLESANDAAAAIAIDIAGSVESFAQKMNEKAAAIGLKNTHFLNPHGLDREEHYTTAEDLARLTAYALQNETFAAIVSTDKTVIPMHNGEASRLLINHNRLLRSYDGAIGVKTGYTKHSGRCLVSAAQRDGVTLIAVTLNASDDWRDHKALLDYGFSRVERVVLADADICGDVPVIGGESDSLSYAVQGNISVVLPKGNHDIHFVTEMSRFLFAPIAEGEPIGKFAAYDGDQLVFSTTITARQEVLKRRVKRSFWQWLTDIFRN